MKKFLRVWFFILILAVVVLSFKDKDYSLLHISNYNLNNMAGNLIFVAFFILVGLMILSRSILFWCDEDYTRAVLKNSEILWSKILGMEKAIKFYQTIAPFGIVLSVAVIIFGIVLYFL